MKATAIFLLFLALGAGADAGHHVARAGSWGVGPLGARIDSFMTAVQAQAVEGTLLVERDGQVILHRGYGIANRARGAPADKRGITIDQLIHHTSGLPYLPRGDLFDSVSTDSMVRETLSYPLAFEPGARYMYSSPGYNLLAVIIEKASGRSFNDAVRSDLFAPAGMSATGFSDEFQRWSGTLQTPSYAGAEADPARCVPGAARGSRTLHFWTIYLTGELTRAIQPPGRNGQAWKHECGDLDRPAMPERLPGD